MDFTMQNATLEDLNELSLLMNQAHKTMEHPEWFATDDDVYLKTHLEKHGFIVTARTKDKTLAGFFVIKYPAVSENYLGQILNFSDTQMQADSLWILPLSLLSFREIICSLVCFKMPKHN